MKYTEQIVMPAKTSAAKFSRERQNLFVQRFLKEEPQWELVKKEVKMTIPMQLLAVLAGVYLLSGAASGKEHKFSERYAMEIDSAARQQLGETVYNEVADFFHAAERAIETKDLKALMDLYSDNYKDGEHDKKSAEQIWKRIFARFDSMTTQHTMQLANVSADKNMVVLRCSGLLLGVPEPSKSLITIDNWAIQDHVLVKEAGKWKLIGTYGTERKRLWFDKPMHPLF